MCNFLFLLLTQFSVEGSASTKNSSSFLENEKNQAFLPVSFPDWPRPAIMLRRFLGRRTHKVHHAAKPVDTQAVLESFEGTIADEDDSR